MLTNRALQPDIGDSSLFYNSTLQACISLIISSHERLASKQTDEARMLAGSLLSASIKNFLLADYVSFSSGPDFTQTSWHSSYVQHRCGQHYRL
jgi:hypothetical protein